VGGKYLSPVNLDVEKLASAVKEVADANAKAVEPSSDQPAKTPEQNAADAKANQKAATAVKAVSKTAGQAAKGAKTQQPAVPGAAPPTANTSADNVNVEVISRQTMRIKIPSDAKPSRIKDAHGSDTYVEVYVATPNGISNSLLIPYRKAEKKDEKVTSGAKFGYSIDPESLTLTYKGKLKHDDRGNVTESALHYQPPPGEEAQSLKIKLEDVVGFVPKLIDANFEVELPGDKHPRAISVKVNGIVGDKGIYTIEKGKFVKFANDLASPANVERIVGDSKRDDSLSTTVQLTPSINVPGMTAVPRKAANALKVTFQFIIEDSGAVGAGQPQPPGGNQPPPAGLAAPPGASNGAPPPPPPAGTGPFNPPRQRSRGTVIRR
jgi:hypothetical protein